MGYRMFYTCRRCCWVTSVVSDSVRPIDGSPPGSPVPGTLQARTLEWVAISFSNAWKWKVKVKLLSRVRLSDPMDCSLPGSSIHGIFQARVLEWGAIALSDIIYSFLMREVGESRHLLPGTKWTKQALNMTSFGNEGFNIQYEGKRKETSNQGEPAHYFATVHEDDS